MPISITRQSSTRRKFWVSYKKGLLLPPPTRFPSFRIACMMRPECPGIATQCSPLLSDSRKSWQRRNSKCKRKGKGSRKWPKTWTARRTNQSVASESNSVCPMDTHLSPLSNFTTTPPPSQENSSDKSLRPLPIKSKMLSAEKTLLLQQTATPLDIQVSHRVIRAKALAMRDSRISEVDWGFLICRPPASSDPQISTMKVELSQELLNKTRERITVQTA